MVGRLLSQQNACKNALLRGLTCRLTADAGSLDRGQASEPKPLLYQAPKALEVVMAVGEGLAGC